MIANVNLSNAGSQESDLRKAEQQELSIYAKQESFLFKKEVDR
jgi:hypothetical protein